ncbi:signal transduction histidine kinase [Desulfovibrio sp. X2]|uniref:sensor histidine kinase n=1 Tax=Desulfovibrio sp. X2 TaxID=941449 RepID=UPI000358E366|nr:histidine kinase dimerization/phosphoacceptor domain -containing protein [Desulfovibrio sp. X2]EPR40872.1 signal transduction histidine kinase [Desulfovibrio sp. X2]
MKPRPSLQRLVRTRLLPWMLLPVLLMVAVLGLYLARSRLEAVRVQDRMLSASLAQNVVMYLDGAVEALGYLARLHDLDVSSQAMAAAMQSLQADKRFARILLLDKNRTILKASPEEAPGLDFPVSFPALAGPGNVISRPMYSPESDELTIYVRHVTADGDMVLGELNLGDLQHHLQSFVPKGEGGVVFLTDAFGNVVAHPDPWMVRTQANLGSMSVLRALSTEQDSFDLVRAQGRTWFGSGAVVPAIGWRLVILKPARMVLRPIAALSATFLGLCLAYVAFLALLVLRQIRRNIVSPIDGLTQGIQAVARGDYTKLRGGTQDFRELAIMAREFGTMARTVSEREEALRQSREKYRSIFENAAEGITQSTPEGRFLSANPAAARIFGFEDPLEVIAYFEDIGRQLYVDPSERLRVVAAAREHGEAHMQVRMRRRDGTGLWVELHARGVFHEGRLVMLESILEDVSERRKAEDELRASLDEKEILLREIHHRVKNNLQIISSLLYLQALSIKEEATQEVFFESQSRIATMALVHEELYRSKDFSAVDLREYTDKLLRRLIQSLGTTTVRVEQETEPLPLPLQQAIPCGLVLNELVTNAVKHAFRQRGGGTLRLVIRNMGERGLLRLSDDGPGLPEGFDPARCETLGMQLVSRLAGQRRGTLTVGRGIDGGASFEFVFPVRAEEDADLM